MSETSQAASGLPAKSLPHVIGLAFGRYQKFVKTFAWSALRTFPGCQVTILLDKLPNNRTRDLLEEAASAYGGSVTYDTYAVAAFSSAAIRHVPIAGGSLKLLRWLYMPDPVVNTKILVADIDTVFLRTKADVYWHIVDSDTKSSYFNVRRAGEQRISGGNHYILSPAYWNETAEARDFLWREEPNAIVDRLGRELLEQDRGYFRDEQLLWWICLNASPAPWQLPIVGTEVQTYQRIPGVHYGPARNSARYSVFRDDDLSALRSELQSNDFKEWVAANGDYLLKQVVAFAQHQQVPSKILSRLVQVWLQANPNSLMAKHRKLWS